MQNAKDSFYMALRTRLAALNPDRTVLLRGTVRPGILVEEAEAPFSQPPNDVFMLAGWAWALIWISPPPWRPTSAKFSIRQPGRRALADSTAGAHSAGWMRSSSSCCNLFSHRR